MFLYSQDIREVTTLAEDWMIGLLILQLLILAWLSWNYSSRLKALIPVILKREFEKQEYKEKLNWTSTWSQAFMSLFFLTISWFIYLVIKNFNWIDLSEWNHFLFYVLILIIVILLYFLKLLLLNVIGVFSLETETTGQYAYTIGQHYHLISFLLMPVVWLVSFNPGINHEWLLYTGLGLYALIYLMRLIRGALNSLDFGAYPFYLILYLCTFEFLPLAVAFWLVNT